MPNVERFEDLDPEFSERTSRIVWATAATVDRQGCPRTRVLHPIWEGSTGWILTGRQTLKTKHLARVPYLSLTYWDQQHDVVSVDSTAQWEDDPASKQRIWDLFKSTPEPLGYDPGMIWPKLDESVGLLRLIPYRAQTFVLGGWGDAKFWSLD